MGADNAKTLLAKYIDEKYTNFTLNDDSELTLPRVSSVPWISVSNRKDVYKKIKLPHDDSHVCFISKNDEPYSFLWKTSPEKLKDGVRWGIVRTESITGKVISALGKYRIAAHERVIKGMMSNTQDLKLKLLDLYQDRFEALQELESLVNTNSSKEQYEFIINRYIERLTQISDELDDRFNNSILLKLHAGALIQIKKDLAQDIARANDYLHSLKDKQSLKSNNRARGNDSILEFVKRQMNYNLYELQGMNQDLTYSNKRWFALTRGELNDYIEDARKEIDDHQADPRNAVTAKHHGLYCTNLAAKVSYDFSMDDLTAERERQVLLGISFIEGWDKVENSHSSTPYVTSGEASENLSIITATNWQRHRNFKVFLKSTAYFFLNMIKGVFAETQPWEEEAWSDEQPNFHLFAKKLRQEAKPNQPLWFKPYYFIKSLTHVTVDIFKGIRTIGSQLVFRLPVDIFNDWASTNDLPDFDLVTKVAAERELEDIRKIEADSLNNLLGNLDYKITTSAATSMLAQSEYRLTSGEANDILTAVVRGVDGFSSIFTHEIYAKDPFAGLLFTATYAVGGAAIFMPTASVALFGSAYVNWFTGFSYAMGSSKLAATIAGGSTQAQLAVMAWDLVLRGPNSVGANTAKQVLKNPITIIAYAAAAYGLGYVLANGIGHPIPWLSETIKEDSGKIPETNYPILGGKLAIALYELLATHEAHPYHPVKIRFNGTELDNYPEIQLSDSDKEIINRLRMVSWLTTNALDLPKLSSDNLNSIARHIDALFKPEEAAALKKILYPEKERSIAYQLFAIPLSYLPALLRLTSALIMSGVAGIMDKPHPLQPIKEAGGALGNKIAKDLNRLVIATVGVVHLSTNIASSLLKALIFALNMTVGRLAGLVNWHPAQTMHKGIAYVHVFFNKIGEFFYPARATKSVVDEHPNQAVKTVEETYRKFMSSLCDSHDDLKKEMSAKGDIHEGVFSVRMFPPAKPQPCQNLSQVTEEYDEATKIFNK